MKRTTNEGNYWRDYGPTDYESGEPVPLDNYLDSATIEKLKDEMRGGDAKFGSLLYRFKRKGGVKRGTDDQDPTKGR